jgi:molybdopterin-guanine dinucleotide biosynthesis protein
MRRHWRKAMRYTPLVSRDAETKPQPVAVGVVLAGGAARRMGRDKRRLLLDGATLVARNIAFLRSVFPTVALSVRDLGQLDESIPADVEALVDEVPGSPLGGIATALTRFNAPVFALAGDTAFAERSAVERVLAAFAGADVALPIVEGHLEPLHAIYGPGCAGPIARLLARGQHSILDLLPLVRVVNVEFDSAAPFFNINTPDDWEEAQRRLSRVMPTRPAVLGIVGRSNSGKTTFIEKLIPELVALGLKVGAVKSVPGFEIDTPGKDSWRHGQSGAEAYAIASSSRLAYVTSLPPTAQLSEIVGRFFSGYDIVVCEGYRREVQQVVEVFRTGAGHHEPLCQAAETLALATDAQLPHDHRFGLEDAPALARFVVERLGLLGAQE